MSLIMLKWVGSHGIHVETDRKWKETPKGDTVVNAIHDLGQDLGASWAKKEADVLIVGFYPEVSEQQLKTYAEAICRILVGFGLAEVVTDIRFNLVCRAQK